MIIKSSGSGIFIFFLVLSITQTSQAQLYPLGVQYFDNLYIANPSMAGLEQGTRLNLSFRKQWSDIPGSPMTQYVTADHGNNKVGLGISIYNESEGLMHNTRAIGTVAYHLPLNTPEKQFHFGMSIGFINQNLTNQEIVGDQQDALINRYNGRKTYIDGDFGMAYTSDKLSIEASVPNMKSFFRKDFNRLADLAIFYTAISYKMNFGSGLNAIGLEPKICYRGVQGFDNIWDTGSNITFASNRFNLQGMYHSTGSGTFGFGFNYNSNWRLSGTHTTATSDLKGYTTTGDFEINLRLTL